jgi:DNA integrity scanning protein DisA with diadenylate cyclase activity
MDTVERGQATQVGKAVMELLESNNVYSANGDNDEQQQLLQQIKDIVAKARQVIQTAKENVDEYDQMMSRGENL